MEIGSEFWKEDKKYIKENEECFLSGRTALDAILRDVKRQRNIASALLPSYCCHTMIEPVRRNGITVRFYDVFVQNGMLWADIPEPQEGELFYSMQYFGNENICYVNEDMKEWHCLWEVSIEDRTHNCFNLNHSTVADYEYASYRKWMALDGLAVARKRGGRFEGGAVQTNETYCRMRNRAFAIKRDFVDGANVEKSSFLDLFWEAEELLSAQYAGYRPDINTLIHFFHTDIEALRNKRRRNAKQLIQGINDIAELTVLTDLNAECPLFVAVAVENRDQFRQYMTEHQIYCPIHWPLSKEHEGISRRAKEVYQKELSLICDQRYGAHDIEREIRVIREYFHKEGKRS
jgi:hypothetical protein